MARPNENNRKTKNPKVSSSQNDNDEVKNDEPEVWDVIKVINPKDDDKPTCRSKRCKKTAVTVWAASNHPEDTWPVCEKCQLAEFGGWPEGVEPPEDDGDEPAGSGTEKEDASKKTNKRSVGPDNAADSDKPENNDEGTTPTDEQSKDDDEEQWQLLEILSKDAVTGRCHRKCMTEDCKNRAACVYVSSKTPKEKWHTCLDCQVRKNPLIANC
jgi:hypothetical protein